MIGAEGILQVLGRRAERGVSFVTLTLRLKRSSQREVSASETAGKRARLGGRLQQFQAPGGIRRCFVGTGQLELDHGSAE